MNENKEKSEKHIFQKNKQYYTISIYVIATIIISALLLKVIWNWADTLEYLKHILSMLSPFLIGFFIAYLLNPLIKFMDKKVFEELLHIKKSAVRKFLSILLIYIFVFGIIAICIVVIIPELYNSITSIYYGIQGYYNELIKFTERINDKYPELDLTYINSIIEKNSQNIVEMLQSSISKLLPLIYNTSISVISWTINLIIAIMVSCYMLIDKNIMSLNIKRLIYAVSPKEKADSFLSTVYECNKIFSRYIIGKSIDSTIIGLLCFTFMTMLRLKYAVLISVIVGITNMIPYFGPFIGAVPGAILSLTVGWKYCLVFCILVLVLQQFDGLYLGPKILGSSTGLRPVWIIFAITAGGWVAGVAGMFLGVPVVAVIAFLVEQFINKRLEKKNLSPSDFISYSIKNDKENQTGTEPDGQNISDASKDVSS